MFCFLNDCSFTGAFDSQYQFEEYTKRLLSSIKADQKINQRLFVSQQLSQQPIFQEENFIQSVTKFSNRDSRVLVLQWLTKSGQFWDESRTQVEDDYYEYNSIDVTDAGLGEAARRITLNEPASTFSVEYHPDFRITPLNVDHGIPEERLGVREVPNLWVMEELVERLEESPSIPQDWSDFFIKLPELFPSLIFSKSLMDDVKGQPFYPTVRNHGHKLLNTLNLIVEESDERGKLTSCGTELLNNYFIGEKAWFSDESEENIHNFRSMLEFPDPVEEANKLLCTWHGKIKTPQYRIHFEWPRPKGQRKIKVVYIGPKITKH